MIEKIVTSLEISKKLKKLGIVQESIFYWVKRSNKWELMTYYEIEDPLYAFLIHSLGAGCISTWTVTELEVLYGKRKGNPNILGEGIIEFLECQSDIPRFKKELNQSLKEWRKK